MSNNKGFKTFSNIWFLQDRDTSFFNCIFRKIKPTKLGIQKRDTYLVTSDKKYKKGSLKGKNRRAKCAFGIDGEGGKGMEKNNNKGIHLIGLL